MGRKVGVFGADISLDWLHRQLTAIDKEYSLIKAFMEDKKKANTLSIFSSSIIIDSVGTIIAHYDKKRILKDNFYDSLRQQKDPASLQLLKNIKAGKSGIDKSDCRRADTLRVLCTAGRKCPKPDVWQGTDKRSATDYIAGATNTHQPDDSGSCRLRR